MVMFAWGRSRGGRSALGTAASSQSGAVVAGCLGWLLFAALMALLALLWPFILLPIFVVGGALLALRLVAYGVAKLRSWFVWDDNDLR